MLRKTLIAAAFATVALPVSTAYADPPPWAPAHGKRAKDAQRHYSTDNGIRYWRGDDGRYRCRRGDGTTGLLIGGVAGALAGRAIDTNGSRTTGTIVGAAAGALLGREIDRNRASARCR